MPEKLTEEQTTVFVEAFKLIDRDGDGKISTEDLRSVLASFGLDPSEEELRDMLAGSNAVGEHIDLDGFLAIMLASLNKGYADFEKFEL